MVEDPLVELKAMQAALEALTPLDEDARGRATAWLASALGVKGAGVAEAVGSSRSVPFAAGLPVSSNGGDLGTPKQFLAHKAPKTDVEKMAVLAYYLTHARGREHFTTKELSDLNTEAAGQRLSNAAYAASNAQKKNGFLANAPGGKRQIASRGEALVNALPDREAVKAALAATGGKPRRPSGGRRKPATRTATAE